MPHASIWITGIGVVSPIGIGRESFQRGCLAGQSGVRRLTNPWVVESDLQTKIAAQVDDFDPQAAGIDRRDARNMDRTSQFAVAAALEAAADAGLERRNGEGRSRSLDGVDPARVTTTIGSGIGGITSLEISHASWRERRSKAGVKRYALPMLIPNAPAGQVAIQLGAKGESKAISTACAAGTMAVGDGLRQIQAGEADVAFCGGAEGIAGDDDAYGLMGFERLQTLSTRNDEPERASRPFDLDRDGFVLGEGAAVLVLEREEHARARGVTPYACVASYAANCDARSMMQLDETGESIQNLIRQALQRAELQPEEVDYVSAHGTSTRLNDATESKALRGVLGSQADHAWVTALKSMTGHTIAASGPLEIVATAQALKSGEVPPTINYERPDPDCAVRVAAARMQVRLRHALKMSYGFGGHNGCLVLSAL